MKLIYNKKVLFSGEIRDLDAMLARISSELNISKDNIKIEYTKKELSIQRDQELKGFIIDNIFVNKEIIYDMSVVYNTLTDNEKANWIDINNNQIELTKDELGALILEARKKIEEIYFRYRELKDEIEV